jgi:hypothetical protein
MTIAITKMRKVKKLLHLPRQATLYVVNGNKRRSVAIITTRFLLASSLSSLGLSQLPPCLLGHFFVRCE